MPCQGASDSCPPRASGGHHGVQAMAGAAALGGPRSHQPARMGEWRQRAVVGGASAAFIAQCRAGLPLGDRVLSGLPHFVGPWMERTGSDAAFDWREMDASSPPACRQMVDGARGRSALARIVVYPGAYHDFDRANFPAARDCRNAGRLVAGTRPSRHRSGGARRFAKARRGMAGAVSVLLASSERGNSRTSFPDRPV